MHQKMQAHFSEVAEEYNRLRVTDEGPIEFVRGMVRAGGIEVLDVGCGAGRYALKLFQKMGKGMFMHCVDANWEMLVKLRKTLMSHGFEDFRVEKELAENIHLLRRKFDYIFTFNAIHHFRAPRFLRSAAKAMKRGGRLFIYTRTRSQNARTIWGMHFPMFNSKETRLRELRQLEAMCRRIPDMRLEAVKVFRHARTATLGELERQARGRHYSTFSMYSKAEFERAMRSFKKRLGRDLGEHGRVSWFDENTMLVLKKV